MPSAIFIQNIVMYNFVSLKMSSAKVDKISHKENRFNMGPIDMYYVFKRVTYNEKITA